LYDIFIFYSGLDLNITSSNKNTRRFVINVIKKK